MADEKSTWIALHRKITEWRWYTVPNTFRLFVHLLIKANHEDTYWRGVPVLRGQVFTGRKLLAEELDLSEQEIRTALKNLLQSEITIKSTSKYSVVTILNYDSYQHSKQDNQPTSNQQATNKQPTSNQQVTNNQPHPTTKQPEPNKIPIIPLTPSAMSLPITPEDMGSSTTEASGNSAANDPQGMTTMYHKKNNRIDYAATVEDAYEDLGKILGGDGVKRLTDDTQRLMGQQMQLADAMKSMTPLLEQAKTMLQGFDLKNLDGLASMAKQLSGSSTTPQ